MSIQNLNLTKAGAPTSGVNEVLTLFSGANTIQEISLTNAPTGGTFTLTFDGATTAPIAFDASAAAIKAALVATGKFVAADITSAGGALPGAPVTLEFKGAYAATKMAGADVALLVGDGALLTGAGDQPAVTVALKQANPSGGTFTFSLGGKTTGALAFDILPEAMQAALESLSTIGAGNVVCSGGATIYGPLYAEEQTITFVNDLGGVDVGALTADDTLLEVPAGCAAAATTITETTKGVEGDFRGAPKTSILADTTNSKLYQQTGEPSTPQWTAFPVV